MKVGQPGSRLVQSDRIYKEPESEQRTRSRCHGHVFCRHARASEELARGCQFELENHVIKEQTWMYCR